MISIKLPSPVHLLDEFENGVQLFIKREDQSHVEYGGNKWRKLKYNIEEFRKGGFTEIVSFGGAFSNHIHSLSLICRELDIASVGIIRGEIDDKNNPTLSDARKAGMRLIACSRSSYRDKEQSSEVQEILNEFENPYIIPEGGSNTLAKKGVMEMIAELDSSYDYIFLPAGTGMTATGVIEAAPIETSVQVVNVLRNESLSDTIETNLSGPENNWQILSGYHFGGFARVNDELLEWNRNFYKKYSVPLDPVYNAKAMYALFEKLNEGYFKQNSKILYIHTGGLQGIRAFEYLNKKSWLRQAK